MDKLLEALSRSESIRHVQRIVISGALCLNDKKSTTEGWRSWSVGRGLGEISEDEEPVSWAGRHVVYDEPVIRLFS